ncbi:MULTISPECIES: hypothetical protein [Actinomyces]|uniref:Uncharacterized protein n=1 Tax=Actinomyces respiraculi TaxID=2744574 RepID=A0A7T0LLE6_9ACTO|nr:MULTISPECIES: hypothetical protein [Actinomyces]QPL05298.1 hypothetical protein ID810_11390 [Actinomyces respiraculi]
MFPSRPLPALAACGSAESSGSSAASSTAAQSDGGQAAAPSTEGVTDAGWLAVLEQTPVSVEGAGSTVEPLG